jgi:hypothetical protein
MQIEVKLLLVPLSLPSAFHTEGNRIRKNSSAKDVGDRISGRMYDCVVRTENRVSEQDECSVPMLWKRRQNPSIVLRILMPEKDKYLFHAEGSTTTE